MAKLIEDGALKIQNLSAVEIQRIEPLDLMGLVRGIWYGKYVIALCVALGVVTAGYYAFAVAQPRYAATTTLEINGATSPAMNVEQALTGGTDPAQINTEVAILRSRHLMAQVVAHLDLTADPEFNRYLTPVPPLSATGLRTRLRNALTGEAEVIPDQAAILEKTAQNLSDAISAGVQRDTYIFHITATTGTPAKSALIANTLAQVYLADQVAGKHAETETAVNWLSDRVYDLQLQLEAKETAVNDLIAQARVQDNSVFDALSRQADETASRLADAQANLAASQTALAGMSVAQQVATTGNLTRERLSTEVDRYTNQVAALSVFQTSLNRQLAEQSAGLIRLQQLRREAEATRVIYETFLARLQETSIQRGLQNPDSRVLAHATQGTYVAPRKMLILAIAGLLGALAGIGIVLLRQALRSGFTDATELAKVTGLPVMAQIPLIARRKGGQVLDYLRQKPTSVAAEAVRNLRTSLLLADQGRVPQVILSTSSIPGEGKTTQAIALAQNLAGLGKAVLLIEADIRQGTFARYFQHGQQGSFIDVLTGQTALADAVVTDARLGADVLSARPMLQNPADLFASPALGALLAQLRKTYDYIIIDAPPVLPVPDARLLAQHVDAVLYAVRWNKTPRHLVLAGQHALEGVNAPITGLVLAQVDGRKMHQYGGSYFASYGQPYYQN